MLRLFSLQFCSKGIVVALSARQGLAAEHRENFKAFSEVSFKSAQTFVAQSFSGTLRVLDVRAENRGNQKFVFLQMLFDPWASKCKGQERPWEIQIRTPKFMFILFLFGRSQVVVRRSGRPRTGQMNGHNSRRVLNGGQNGISRGQNGLSRNTWADPGVLWKNAPKAMRAMRGKTLETVPFQPYFGCTESFLNILSN